MNFGINCITGGGDEMLKIHELQACHEKLIQQALAGRDYGGNITEFSVVILSIDSDPVENKKHYSKENKVSKYKDFKTGKMSHYISIALPIDPDLVIGMSQKEFNQLFLTLFMKKLDEPDLKIPKTFDYQTFKKDLSDVLEILTKVDFE